MRKQTLGFRSLDKGLKFRAGSYLQTIHSMLMEAYKDGSFITTNDINRHYGGKISMLTKVLKEKYAPYGFTIKCSGRGPGNHKYRLWFIGLGYSVMSKSVDKKKTKRLTPKKEVNLLSLHKEVSNLQKEVKKIKQSRFCLVGEEKKKVSWLQILLMFLFSLLIFLFLFFFFYGLFYIIGTVIGL